MMDKRLHKPAILWQMTTTTDHIGGKSWFDSTGAMLQRDT